MGLFNWGKKKEQKKEKLPVERYMEHLDSIFKVEPKFFQEESMTPGWPKMTVIVYADIPEKGYITAFTYGLSLVNHPEWKFGRPELCISVKSTDFRWAHAAGYIANQLRGACPFTYDESINFHAQISEESEMDAFFVFAPSTINKEFYADIDVGAAYRINIAGLYPMYSEEIPVLREIGLKKFWHHPDFDNYDVNRPRIKGL